MNELKKLEKSILKNAVILSIIISLVLVLILKRNSIEIILGLILGLSISSLNFIELSNSIKRSVQMKPERAQSYTVKKYFVRYVISGISIYVAVVAPYINVIGTIMGMLLIKFVIIFTNLLDDKQFYINIFKSRREV